MNKQRQWQQQQQQQQRSSVLFALNLMNLEAHDVFHNIQLALNLLRAIQLNNVTL